MLKTCPDHPQTAPRALFADGLPLPTLGRIAAGFPLEAIEDRQRDELMNWLVEPGRHALRVGDDSMVGCGIYRDDIVVIQSQQRARNGDIVAAMVDDEPLALRRIRYLDRQRIRLFIDDPESRHRDLAQARVAIAGRVIGQLRRYP